MNISSNEVRKKRDRLVMYEYFEQRGPEEARLSGDVRIFRVTGPNEARLRGVVRIFRATRSGRGTIEVLFEYFEQRGPEEARLRGVVRIFRVTRSGRGTIEWRCTNISSNEVRKRHD
ncbi:hypothetical protein [Cohnella abietis]|uniref:hypothetical protein n=1 Tax=Cohnella abietis TaxID=2507935 RepID=UPI00102E47EA|nr:hypothetical protein [Cohnella abietis]